MEKPVCEFCKETLETALPFKSGKYFFKLLFYGSSMMAPFKHLRVDLRELYVNESVWVCPFFLYCTFKHEDVSVYCKNEEGRETEKGIMSEICHLLIKTLLRRDTSVDAMYLSSPLCCYPSHVQIKYTVEQTTGNHNKRWHA